MNLYSLINRDKKTNSCLLEIGYNTDCMKGNFGFDIARRMSMFYIVGILHLTGYTELAIAQNNAFQSAKYWQSGFLKLINSKYTLLLLSIYLPLFSYLLMGKGNRILMMCEGYIGIVALLNIYACVGNVLQSNHTFTKVISYLSYASMCAYLFHREVYWMLWARYTPPSNDWYIILYLFFIGVPVTFFLSYYIQRGYDKLVSRI